MIRYVNTKFQLADICTKAFSKAEGWKGFMNMCQILPNTKAKSNTVAPKRNRQRRGNKALACIAISALSTINQASGVTAHNCDFSSFCPFDSHRQFSPSMEFSSCLPFSTLTQTDDLTVHSCDSILCCQSTCQNLISQDALFSYDQILLTELPALTSNSCES